MPTPDERGLSDHRQAAPTLRTARFTELDSATLYDLLRLRVDVFVVEQRAPYPELDGQDTDPGTWHVWCEQDGAVVAYLRLLNGSTGEARIGRVCTAPAARGTGLAGRLMSHALGLVGDRSCVLDAQSYLVDFYAAFGFAPAGPEFIEDGIPHTPMRRG